MPYVRIGRNAKLTNVVIDKGVTIPEGLVVGEDPKQGRGTPLIVPKVVFA